MYLVRETTDIQYFEKSVKLNNFFHGLDFFFCLNWEMNAANPVKW